MSSSSEAPSGDLPIPPPYGSYARGVYDRVDWPAASAAAGAPERLVREVVLAALSTIPSSADAGATYSRAEREHRFGPRPLYDRRVVCGRCGTQLRGRVVEGEAWTCPHLCRGQPDALRVGALVGAP